MRWAKRWSRRLRAVVRRDEVERELDEELTFHLEMETEKNLRAGMSPDEARRRAAIAFGGVQKHREEVRDARAFGWLSGLSLDARLGARMLFKYPGLTLVGGFGMAVAIAMAATFDASMGAAISPMPMPGGDRIVALEVFDAEIDNQTGQFLYDYGVWEEELRSVDILGAYRTRTRNLIVPGGTTEPVRLAEVTSTGFGIIGTPPLLGRPVVEEDEAAGSPPVAVLSHDLWQSRFGGDPNVVGRDIRLGRVVHTVVGVMPEGFGFPLDHQLWVPFQLEPATYAPREGPAITAFGRLAPGATIQSAQTELTALGNSIAAAFPETHRHLRPRVIQYGPHLLDDLEGWEIPMVRVIITLLLIIIAVNVSVLVFARTAARAGEITVRSALGASRRRIVTQFFAEGLVLAGVSAALGLAIAIFSLRRIEGVMDALLAPMGGLPFWMDFRLSPRALVFAVGLAVLAAVIVGIIPAVRATGSRLQTALRALGGATGMRLGRVWSLLIVAQVAFTVAILPGTIYFAVDFARYGMRDPGFPADEYLTTMLLMDRDVDGLDVPVPEFGARYATPPVPEAAQNVFEARYATLVSELDRRLAGEPAVLGRTLSMALPSDEAGVRFEVEGTGGGIPALNGQHGVRYNTVDLSFFQTYDTPVLAGRGFESADLGPTGAVVVNRSFVDEVLGGASALGRRMRFAQGYRAGGVVHVPAGIEPERWYEIVGVVDDLPPVPKEPDHPRPQVYRPLEPGSTYPLSLSLRMRGNPEAFAPRLREISAAIDPSLQTRYLMPLEAVVRELQDSMRLVALGLGLLIGSVLLLSSAGIYALMSFTVTQRRREIGIRSALGANPRRVLASIFSRAAAQLGAGAALGLGFATWIDVTTEGEMTGGTGGIVLPAVAGIILTVGLLAAWGPARRGLRIQPMEALREE
jgi:putative ABC transport system permease protein